MHSQISEYALRVAACLATREDGYVAAFELIKRASVPRNYLDKVLPALNSAGVIETRRGFGGGHRLARDPADITLSDVVDAVGSLDRVKPTTAAAQRNEPWLRPLRSCVDESIAAATHVLERRSLADIVRTDAAGASIVEARPIRRAAAGAKAKTGAKRKRVRS
ncbi:MAG: Rrf2 family transcriptional regulator [Phycisphaerales bacterium]|nr:MAG: Rrf2 family transcriptional regulator [Phycisphaerales bacterium]